MRVCSSRGFQRGESGVGDFKVGGLWRQLQYFREPASGIKRLLYRKRQRVLLQLDVRFNTRSRF